MYRLSAFSECFVLAAVAGIGFASARDPSPADWVGDLAPISASDWTYERAAHLLERAGFGGAPAEIEHLAAMSPAAAVA